jgi:hypothetical protein
VRPVVARATVDRPAAELHALLADLPGHWRLAGRWVQPLVLDDDGGVVRIRGPLGLSRTASTRVLRSEPPSLVAGEARLGSTRAAVTWSLVPRGERTEVTLRADLLAVSPVDRLLLAVGARRWLAARFAATLQRLR